MFTKVALKDWEQLVQKQLKTEDIYSLLTKENLEGLKVNPYYDTVDKPLANLPKIEESTHLVAPYQERLKEHAFAFLLCQNVEGLSEKAIFLGQADILKTLKYQTDNQYYALIDVFDEQAGTLSEDLAQELLNQNFTRNIAIDVALHQNAGAAIYQQLGIALAKTKELVEIFGKDILKKLIIRIAVGSNYFFELSKIRALKLIYNQLSKEFDLDEIPYIFAETTLRNKSKADEENNLIRSTLELAASMIGGADAVFANDYKLQNNTELSQEIAFKQQIVLAYESIINVFEDASNGSYFIEDLTQQIAEQSWQYFIDIEECGGYLNSLKSGKIQKDIYAQAIAEQEWVETGKIKLIGVNLYPQLEKKRNAETLYSEKEIKPVRLAQMFE